MNLRGRKKNCSHSPVVCLLEGKERAICFFFFFSNICSWKNLRSDRFFSLTYWKCFDILLYMLTKQYCFNVLSLCVYSVGFLFPWKLGNRNSLHLTRDVFLECINIYTATQVSHTLESDSNFEFYVPVQFLVKEETKVFWNFEWAKLVVFFFFLYSFSWVKVNYIFLSSNSLVMSPFKFYQINPQKKKPIFLFLIHYYYWQGQDCSSNKKSTMRLWWIWVHIFKSTMIREEFDFYTYIKYPISIM